MPVNPYRISEAELRRSTGHAEGQPLVETRDEVTVPHDLPIRVSPMSPASEIAALGQLTRARPGRRRAARLAALVLLTLTAAALLYNVVLTLGR